MLARYSIGYKLAQGLHIDVTGRALPLANADDLVGQCSRDTPWTHKYRPALVKRPAWTIS